MPCRSFIFVAEGNDPPENFLQATGHGFPAVF
jgi:hypothetical protein